jgi:anti-sigma B factor antagonist
MQVPATNFQPVPLRSFSHGLVVVRQSFPGIEVLHVFDEVDLATASELEAEINALPHAGRVVLDFAECRYIDSTALSVLIRAHKALGDRLQLIVRDDGIVGRLLKITGLDNVFSVVPTLNQALAA